MENKNHSFKNKSKSFLSLFLVLSLLPGALIQAEQVLPSDNTYVNSETFKEPQKNHRKEEFITRDKNVKRSNIGFIIGCGIALTIPASILIGLSIRKKKEAEPTPNPPEIQQTPEQIQQNNTNKPTNKPKNRTLNPIEHLFDSFNSEVGKDEVYLDFECGDNDKVTTKIPLRLANQILSSFHAPETKNPRDAANSLNAVEAHKGDYSTPMQNNDPKFFSNLKKFVKENKIDKFDSLDLYHAYGYSLFTPYNKSFEKFRKPLSENDIPDSKEYSIQGKKFKGKDLKVHSLPRKDLYYISTSEYYEDMSKAYSEFAKESPQINNKFGFDCHLSNFFFQKYITPEQYTQYKDSFFSYLKEISFTVEETDRFTNKIDDLDENIKLTKIGEEIPKEVLKKIASVICNGNDKATVLDVLLSTKKFLIDQNVNFGIEIEPISIDSKNKKAVAIFLILRYAIKGALQTNGVKECGLTPTDATKIDLFDSNKLESILNGAGDIPF